MQKRLRPFAWYTAFTISLIGTWYAGFLVGFLTSNFILLMDLLLVCSTIEIGFFLKYLLKGNIGPKVLLVIPINLLIILLFVLISPVEIFTLL